MLFEIILAANYLDIKSLLYVLRSSYLYNDLL
jgi:SCF ubiquitin ligase, SKP1 component